MNLSKNITILGGGTSAWLTAAFFSQHLPKDYFTLTIIEGKFSKSIGVGESTLPFFPKFMENCGFNINEWFPFCECTPKVGVGFKDWISKGSTYWHPFANMPLFKDGSNLFDIVNHLNLSKSNISQYYQKYNKNYIQNLPPKNIQGVHINAEKLSEFIKQKIKIKTIKEDIIDLYYDQGNLNTIHLSSGKTFTSPK